MILVYIVQDLDGNIRGVFDSLELAVPVFNEAYNNGLAVLAEVGFVGDDDDDPFGDCDAAPLIAVWNINEGWMDSYDNPDEIERALAKYTP